MPNGKGLYGQRSRVSINFAEGQYALFAGSVPTASALKGDFTTQKQS